MAGRRLRDGVIVREPLTISPYRAVVFAAALVTALATCPSHDSFATYLGATLAHPSGVFGGLSRAFESLSIAVSADSHSYLLFRVGSFRGERFVGLYGTWLWLPVPATSLAVCDGAGGGAPHELFLALCLVALVLWQVAPRFMWRHAACSLRAVQQGRVHTMLTANVSHLHPLHLLHNALQLLHFGSILRSALGCERLLTLLATSSVASSAASLLWHALAERPSEASVGASGVACALVAANAALFPDTLVHFYGIEMPAAHQLIVFVALDLAAQAGGERPVDGAAHAGGAACGWLLARRWRGLPWWRWLRA